VNQTKPPESEKKRERKISRPTLTLGKPQTKETRKKKATPWTGNMYGFLPPILLCLPLFLSHSLPSVPFPFCRLRCEALENPYKTNSTKTPAQTSLALCLKTPG